MMKKITLSLLLVSMLIPMTLNAQKVKKDVLSAPSVAAIIWDFESGEQYDDWKAVDNDGDVLTWRYHYNEGDPDTRMKTHGGEGLVQSASYNNFTGEVLTPDNWLISPEVTLGGVLSFWALGRMQIGVMKCSVSLSVWATPSTQPISFR